jgi:peptide/nickel transport system ATP-binding protein
VAACLQQVPTLEPAGAARAVRCIRPLSREDNAALAGVASPQPELRPEPALAARDLRASYGAVEVVHGASFELPLGQCTAIVGESGSGKTTLARCLAGLHGAWKGEVALAGEPLGRTAADRSKEQLRRMQYIFQNPYASLNPTMTVAENIAEPLRHFERLSGAQRRERALMMLDTVALSPEFADLLPNRISGGERQRVAVARALVVNPEILVCDEITSALDVSVQALLIEELRDLQLERGLSMVFITHNLAVVRSIAQNVIVLERGTVVEAGAVEDVLSNPQHPYTRQLMEDLPRLAAAA